MKKLFISQPMRGKTDEEILAVRKQAIEAASELVGEPVEVIDSFFSECASRCKATVVFRKIAGTSGRCRRGLFYTGLERCPRLHHRTRLCDCLWNQKHCSVEGRIAWN